MVEIKGRKVIVELDGEAYLTMDDKGVIRNFPTANAVIRWVKDRDNAAAARGTSTATMIEWRNMPEGFKAPE